MNTDILAMVTAKKIGGKRGRESERECVCVRERGRSRGKGGARERGRERVRRKRESALQWQKKERSKRGTIHHGTVVTRQGACRRRRRRVRTKIMIMSRRERKIDGDVQGDCRRLWQIAESSVVFLDR